MTEKFYSPPEFAELLGTTPDRVRFWIDSRQLRASNVAEGKRPRWKISADDAERFLESRANRPTQKTKQPTRRRQPIGNVKEFF